jgi:hypothetical protein
MPAVVIFLDETPTPANVTEVHFFEDDHEAIRFSSANMARKHALRRVDEWHRARDQAAIVEAGEKAFAAGGQEWADWNMQNNPFGAEP